MEKKKYPFLRSFKFAFSGIWQAVKRERNLKIHLFTALLVILAGFYFQISKFEWLVIILIISAVLAAELFNAAIEEISDVVRDENGLGYEATKFVRDVSAGAVLVLAIGAVILGLLIFLPKLFSGII